MGRVLRPGGWALFQVSNDPSIHQPPAAGLEDRVKRALGQAPQQDREWWGSAVDPTALRTAATDGGLEVIKILDEGNQYTTVYLRARS